MNRLAKIANRKPSKKEMKIQKIALMILLNIIIALAFWDIATTLAGTTYTIEIKRDEPMKPLELETVKEIEHKIITAVTTAYSEIDSCHYKGCLMANTKPAHAGAVACPRDIKLGTKIEIDGKEYTCEDRTAKRYDGRFDIWMGYGEESHSKSLSYGIKNKQITIKK